jgi:hypothetical protein
VALGRPAQLDVLPDDGEQVGDGLLGLGQVHRHGRVRAVDQGVVFEQLQGIVDGQRGDDQPLPPLGFGVRRERLQEAPCGVELVGGLSERLEDGRMVDLREGLVARHSFKLIETSSNNTNS